MLMIVCCCCLFCFSQCSFFEYRGYKIVYRRYASLFFVVGVDGEEDVSGHVSLRVECCR